jgi:hypothetical protein
MSISANLMDGITTILAEDSVDLTVESRTSNESQQIYPAPICCMTKNTPGEVVGAVSVGDAEG